MDYKLAVLLLIVGAIIIGFIYFDAKRRQRNRQEKKDQQLFDQTLDNSRDGSGYDMDGVSEVRMVQTAQEKVDTQKAEEIKVKAQKAIDDGLLSKQQKPFESSKEHLYPNFGDETVTEASTLKQEAPVLDDMLFGFDKDTLSDQSTEKKEPEIETPTQSSLFEEEKKSSASKEQPIEPELIFTLYLVSPNDAPYQGEQLVQSLIEQGMRHGDMNIFHRHSQSTGRGPIQFSLANAYAPGTFDLSDLGQLETKGLAVFMTLPGPKNPMKAYELMVSTCKAIVAELGGSIIDSSKAHFSGQIEVHQKEKIQEYERQLLLKKP